MKKKKIIKKFEKSINETEKELESYKEILKRLERTSISNFKIVVGADEIYQGNFLPSDFVKNSIINDFKNKIKELEKIMSIYQNTIFDLKDKC